MGPSWLGECGRNRRRSIRLGLHELNRFDRFVFGIFIALAQRHDDAVANVVPICVVPDQTIAPEANLGLPQQSAGTVEPQDYRNATLRRHTPDGLGGAGIRFVRQRGDFKRVPDRLAPTPPSQPSLCD